MKPAVENRPKKGGSYPPEFREEAVRYWLSSGKKAKEVALEYRCERLESSALAGPDGR